MLATGQTGPTCLVCFSFSSFPKSLILTDADLCVITKTGKQDRGVQLCVELRGCFNNEKNKRRTRTAAEFLHACSDQAGVGDTYR